MEALELIKKALFCSSLCFIIYQTEALAHYAKLLRLDKLLKIDEYFCHKILSDNKKINYFDFILRKKYHFLLALLACPFCFGFWLCLLVSSFHFFDTLVVYWLFILSYKLMIWQK